MQYKFLNIFLDKQELLSQDKKMLNPFLIENNSHQLENLYSFFQNESDLLYVNGFLGTGKAKIVDYSMSFLSSEVVILKYNCFESTILDDILLFFYNEFKKLCGQNVIAEPKIKTENFSQKINSYFSQTEKPFLVILDSFESVLQENRQEILDFITHLASSSKVKIILISRTFEVKYFENSNLKIERITASGMEKPLFEKYLKSEKLKLSSSLLEEFYKNTRGYFFFTELALRIITLKGITPAQFMDEFNKSFTTFHEFLQKQIFELIPPTSRNLFWFLAMLRHPIEFDLLKALQQYNEEKIYFLIKNLVAIEENSSIYVQDYFKDHVDVSIAPQIALKIHQYIIDLYQTQLPLKPLERNILISRQTMRKEIEYHSLFLPKRPLNIEMPDYDINYLAYSRGADFDYTSSKRKKPVLKKNDETKKKPQEIVKSENKVPIKSSDNDLKDLPFKLSKEEMDLLENIDNIKPEEPMDIYINEPITQAFEAMEEEVQTFEDLLEQAQNAEKHYHYARVIDIYKKALEIENDLNYTAQLPMIYTKIAYAYQKIADYENALKYYNLVKKIYENSQEFVKAHYINLSIAKIFTETYKLSKAKELLLEITDFKKNPPVLMTKTFIQLANIEDSLSNISGAYEYYKKALEVSNDAVDIDTMAELYFKYALILDDKNDVRNAMDFYEKCIKLNDDSKINKFLSMAYSNIANLYFEKNDTNNAVKNYLKAYQIDKNNNNYDGMYYLSTKLASVLKRSNPQKAIEYFESAIDCAKTLNDIFYMASASLSFGDYYYDLMQNEIALKYYVNTLNLVKNDFSKENIDKIQMRINDIKFRMGVENFERLYKILKEEY